MIDLLRSGGLLFTAPLTVLAGLVLLLAARCAIIIYKGGDASSALKALFHTGLFSFFFGILGQTLGLYQMMGAVERAGDVAPALLAGGIKVSTISSLYGLIIVAAALVLHLGLALWNQAGQAPHVN